MRLAIALLFSAVLLAPADAAACETLRTSCRVAGGEYRIALPPGIASPPALVWLHGWGGSAEAVVQGPMAARLAERGYALIAPDGVMGSSHSEHRNWSVRDGRRYDRDDVAFLRAVIEDAAGRHGIAVGACCSAASRGVARWSGTSPAMPRTSHAPTRRSPAPSGSPCPSAAGRWIMHAHGWADRTVSLEGGRPLHAGELVQGEVFESLRILRGANGCENRQPAKAPAGQALWARHWSDCAAGRIELLLHSGGHVVPDVWLDRALGWFEALPSRGCAAGSGSARAC